MTTSQTPPKGSIPIPTRRTRLKKRHWLFLSMNAIVLVMVGVAMITNEFADIGLATYVMALFLLCTLPLPLISSFRGPESLLLVFLAYYFGAFGLKDLSDLLAYTPLPGRSSGDFFTDGEIAIFIGAICFTSAYLLVARLLPKRDKGVLNKDWSPLAIALIGICSWAIGFYFTLHFQFGFADRYSGATTISVALGGFMSLLRILQPLGSLILIYLFLTMRSKIALITLLVTMVADFGLGFVGDSKEIAVRAPLLYLFSLALLRNRIPVVTTIVFVVATGIAFSLFAAYRDELGSRHQSRQEGFKEIGSKLDKISGHDLPYAKRLSEGLDYFASRITLKQNMEMIVARTGRDVAFQNGATISPLLYAFVPRIILPNKPDNSVSGRIFNKEFNISPDPDTYISTGHVGELYWNYGWPGLTIGMLIIGGFMAILGTLLRLDKNPTLPKFLVLLMTIYMLSLRFETGIAMTYTVWARTLALLLIIHALTPKIKPRAQPKNSVPQPVVQPIHARILRPARKA